MPRVMFTPHLQRFMDAPAREVSGASVAEALAAVFADNPRLRGYLLDERGRVRTHISVFVGDTLVRDREALTDPVRHDDDIYVLQALSGG